MPYLPVAGTRLFYTESGPANARPMLLLHAALQTGESMTPLRDLLAPLGLRLIQVDLRGHGRTANPARTWSIPGMADDIAALAAELDLKAPLLAGYSLGGMLGIELARRGLLSALVVLASRIRPAPRGRESFDPASIRSRSPQWAATLGERHTEVAWEELATGLGEMLATWPGFDPGELGRIAAPTLVVQGEKDQMVSLRQAEALAALVPGARLYVAPSAGHPELLYRADAMAQVYEFVRDQLNGVGCIYGDGSLQ